MNLRLGEIYKTLAGPRKMEFPWGSANLPKKTFGHRWTWHKCRPFFFHAALLPIVPCSLIPTQLRLPLCQWRGLCRYSKKISKTSILKWHVFRRTWSWRNRCFPMEVCDNSGIPRVVDDRSGPAIYLASRFPVGGLKLGEAAQLGSLKKLVLDFKKHWLVGGSIYWECHNPNWRTHIFQRGWNIGNVIIPPSFFRGVGWNHQPDHH